jgi:predicted nucleotidyltransferase
VDTELGQIDVLQGLPQIPSYALLEEQATNVEVAGLVVRVCSLEHLIEMKRSSDRLRDRDDLEALEAVQREESKGA